MMEPEVKGVMPGTGGAQSALTEVMPVIGGDASWLERRGGGVGERR